jgi:hypothetical protein
VAEPYADETVAKGTEEKRFCWTCHGYIEHRAGAYHAPGNCVTPGQCAELAAKNPKV